MNSRELILLDTAASDNDGQQQSQEAPQRDENVYSWLNDPVAQQEYRDWLDQLDSESRKQIEGGHGQD